MAVAIQKTILVIVVGAGLGALFQNCGSYTAIKQGSPLVYKIDTGQQFAAQSLTPEVRRSVCEVAENYSCVAHHYRPKGEDQTLDSKVCHNGFCVPAIVVTHDASAAIAACTDCKQADVEYGGRYNFDDVYCSNDNITKADQVGSAVVGNQPLADQALAEAMSLCLIAAE